MTTEGLKPLCLQDLHRTSRYSKLHLNQNTQPTAKSNFLKRDHSNERHFHVECASVFYLPALPQRTSVKALKTSQKIESSGIQLSEDLQTGKFNSHQLLFLQTVLIQLPPCCLPQLRLHQYAYYKCHISSTYSSAVGIFLWTSHGNSSL